MGRINRATSLTNMPEPAERIAMFKIMMLASRREDLSMQQFIDHYEHIHAPAAKRDIPYLRHYVRNYVQVMPSQFMNGASETSAWVPDFDVIVEFYFDSRQEFERAIGYVTSPEGAFFAEDEARFFDRASMRYVVVEEHENL
jgi:hypothetical protein